MSDHPTITVPTPFEGASEWLVGAYASLAPQAEAFAKREQESEQQRIRDELAVRRQLTGYLQRYRLEAGRRRREWARKAEGAKRKGGFSSRAFSEASSQVRLLDDLLQAANLPANREAIKHLEALES